MAAHAAPADPFAGSSEIAGEFNAADVQAQFEDLAANATSGAEDTAWELRSTLHAQAGTLPAEAAGFARDTVDAAVNAVFPGLIAARTAPAPAAAPAPGPAPEPAFDTGSCPATADVCVDLDGGRSWLQENGDVSYGAVPISAGGIGQETPRGTFEVNRKVRDEVSYEFNNAPMPYAIYFTYNGHAFHQGNVATTSAGCVRLNQADAQYYFENVHIGDTVHIY